MTPTRLFTLAVTNDGLDHMTVPPANLYAFALLQKKNE